VLWDANLPKLTCLYRFWLYHFDLAGPPDGTRDRVGDKAVRWDEFTLAMRNAGFRSLAQVDVVTKWCCHTDWPSAGKFLAGLSKIGVQNMPGSSPSEAQKNAQAIVDDMIQELHG
jgi:hypothetical protein